MKKILILITLLLSITTSASTITISDVLDIHSYDNYLESLGEFEITNVAFISTATSSGSKLPFNWERCYKSRSLNLPRNIFSPKYNYSPFYNYEKRLISNFSKKRVKIDLNELKSVEQLAVKNLEDSLHSSCKIKTRSRLILELTMKDGQKLNYEFQMSLKNDNEKLITYRHTEGGNITQVSASLLDDFSLIIAQLTSPFSF